MESTVSTEQLGRVVVATLSNPPHALMTMGMIGELTDLVHAWEQDASVGAVVLTGAHQDRFLAHFDVAELLRGARAAPALPASVIRGALAAVDGASRAPRAAELLGRSPASGLLDLLRFHSTLVAMGRSGVAYVAALNGSAMGGGCELALACDLRMMASGDHLIGQPEIMLGFPPGGGGTQRLSRLLGEARALELVLTGDPLGPEEAAAIGLVTRVVAPDALVDDAVATAARLARRSKTGTGASKRAIRDGGSRPLGQGLRIEAAEFMQALTSDAAIRLMEAYVDRSAELGDVAAYDTPTREAMLDGTFLDLHGS